ncbi:MAG: hypothetical protein FJY65_08010 [Calditrichaeota bacterium]|nr:hypothetical protein [Calditrichota bacterium]
MITQFTINLNKGEDVAERLMRRRKRFEIISMTIVLLAVVILGAFNYRQHQSVQKILSAKETIIRDIDRKLDSLKRTGKNISKEDVLALAKLERERVLWTKKFLSLGELLPEEMAITYVEFKNNILNMKFITTIRKDEKEFDKVKEVIDRLRASPLFFRDFSDMKLKEQHQTKVEDQIILSFTVLCSVEKGAAIRGERAGGEAGSRAAQRGQIARAVGGG